MNENLIFDIGMHTGEDTRHYLKKGFKVIAVEANPDLVKRNELKFEQAITDGRLSIVNAGIAEKEGILPFYRNHRLSDWSSFDEALGRRNNTSYDMIEVPCITTASLFEKFGLPYYFKVDIEGFDIHCVNALDPEIGLPRYFSCEGSDIQHLDILSRKGYTKFKVISQCNNFRPLTPHEERRRFLPLYLTVMNGIKIRTQEWLSLRHYYGSAGPFAEETKGKWLSYEAARESFETFLFGRNGKPLNRVSWFDFHATT